MTPTLIVFTPWVGAALIALLPKSRAALALPLALIAAASTLVFGLSAYGTVSHGTILTDLAAWAPSFGIDYKLSIDGISLLLILLTGIVAPLCLLISPEAQRKSQAFTSLFLVLQGAALGVFTAKNFFLWFLFWEVSLIPSYFLIRVWGGAKSAQAAYKFVVFTLSGSAFMLIAFAGLFFTAHTLDFDQLAKVGSSPALAGTTAGTLLFLGVLAGLAVKAPLYPFHSWLPDAYAEAPTGASMFLTAILSKMGVFGFFRILAPLFPAQLAVAAPILLWFAIAGVVVGALAAFRQTDMKRMFAYSSVNHVSYCLVALFAVAAHGVNARGGTAAVSGAYLQMFNHGISAAALFAVAGILASRNGGSLDLSKFGGVRTVAPILTGLGGIAVFSSIGLPGLGGFVGEFLIFQGAFASNPLAATVACIGILTTAIFLLKFVQQVFTGPVVRSFGVKPDVTTREGFVLLAFALIAIAAGVYPQPLATLITPLASTLAFSP